MLIQHPSVAARGKWVHTRAAKPNDTATAQAREGRRKLHRSEGGERCSRIEVGRQRERERERETPFLSSPF